jgi:hypothetical protein
MQFLERLIHLGGLLKLDLALDRAQELYFKTLLTKILPRLAAFQEEMTCPVALDGVNIPSELKWDLTHIQQLLRLGQQLCVDVSPWLE